MSRFSQLSGMALRHTDPLVLAIAAAALIAISLLAVDYFNTPYTGSDNMRGMLDTAGAGSVPASIPGQSG